MEKEKTTVTTEKAPAKKTVAKTAPKKAATKEPAATKTTAKKSAGAAKTVKAPASAEPKPTVKKPRKTSAKATVPAVKEQATALAVKEKAKTPTTRAKAEKPTIKEKATAPAVKEKAKAPAPRAKAKTPAAPLKPFPTDNATEVKAEEIAKTAPKKPRVLMCAAEAWPFAGTGGLGEVIGSLPKALNAEGEAEASVILPLYESVPAEYREKMEFITHITVPLAWRNQYCGLFKLVRDGVTFYFVDNEYYFKRGGLYGYGDDGERFAFLSRAILELLPYIDFKPDVLHCHDWHTALVPIYYKLYYQYRENLGGIRTVFTIHNIEYQGQFSGSVLEDLFGISYREYMSVEYHGCINLMKGAIDYSDAVTTVSPTYADEIKRPEYAHGLENVLLKNAYKLRGILNGIDTDVYNPATNPALFKNYDDKTVDEYKKENKLGLQRMLSLPEDENVPMIAMISRLVSHKGFDIVRSAFGDILRDNVQFVVLGTGDAEHENFFRHMQSVYGDRVRSVIAFNKDMAQKIYAAADIFLMPSKSEPCGLSQMMALRYGTIPVVRGCGGLRDSVFDCGNGDAGNGFTFDNYDRDSLIHAVDRAVGLCRDYRDKWISLRHRAMECDYSWDSSARKYADFYKELI